MDLSELFAAMGLDASVGMEGLAAALGMSMAPPPVLLSDEVMAVPFGGAAPTIDALAERLRAGAYSSIVVVAGAGLSVSAGVPDFRSPSGLYAALDAAGQDLPRPEAVFELEFFRSNPVPFYALAGLLMPGAAEHSPTAAHFFLRLLHDRGVLRRVYTQNIDGLERATGLPDDVVVQVHGNFDHAHCPECAAAYDIAVVKDAVAAGTIPRCADAACAGAAIKPDIVFFGESLPELFFPLSRADMREADLVIVMGTSLSVYPVAALPDDVDATIPRLLINRERVGSFGAAGGNPNYRDVLALGDLDEQVRLIAAAIGPDWAADLDALSPPVADPDAAAAATTARVAAASAAIASSVADAMAGDAEDAASGSP